MQPYYEDEYVTLYCGDNREVLPQLEGQYFGFTDPVYNVGKDYGVWDDSLPDDVYLEFCQFWIKEMKRLCPEFAVYPPRKYYLEYWTMLGREFKQIVLPWTPEGAYRDGYVDQYAAVLSNARPKVRTKNVWFNVQMRGLGYFFKEQTYGHPGYTSEDLTNRVLWHLADPAAIVVDPFAGVGTTLVCAKRFNRRAIGIELNPAYCAQAVERLNQPVLPLWTPAIAQSPEPIGSQLGLF